MADSPLQKAPLGLLGAFDLKTLGQQPTKFGDAVLPVADVFDLYGQDLAEVFSNTLVTAAPTASALVELNPLTPNTLWRVLAIGAQIDLAAGDAALRSQTFIEVGDNSSPILRVPLIAAGEQNPSGLAYDGRRTGLLLPRPLVLPLGWRLTCSAILGAAPASNWTLRLRVLAQVLPV